MVTCKHTPNFKKNSFEKAAWDNGNVVAGIDEVGRGCLAGPVVTAAVILPPFKAKAFLKDSKLMTAPEREAAYQWIVKHCIYSVGIVDHRIVDERNVWHATLIGMKKAALHLLAIAPQQPSAFLVDAMPFSLACTAHEHTIDIHHFYFGERKSSSIAAASIVAKVTRDALMARLMDTQLPGYAFGQHKGYSTPLHQTNITTLGVSLIHRVTYIQSPELLLIDDTHEQQTIC